MWYSPYNYAVERRLGITDARYIPSRSQVIKNKRRKARLRRINEKQ